MNKNVYSHAIRILEILFDPVDVDHDRLGSVSFNVKANWKGTYQSATVELRDSWFFYSELDEFFRNLNMLKTGRVKLVELNNMSGYRIIAFSIESNEIVVSFEASDCTNRGKSNVEAEISREELELCVEKVRAWEKWW